jgi:hypothetical protein
MEKRYVILLLREDNSPAHAIGCFASDKDAHRFADQSLHLKRSKYRVVSYSSAAGLGW